MPNINIAFAPQPHRVRVVFVSAAGAGTSPPSDWTVRREGVVRHPVAQAWFIDATTAELALEEPLEASTRYTVEHVSGASAVWFAYDAGPRITHTAALEEQGDPEAEAFGRDIDWLSDTLTPTRDLPEAAGLPALKHDLAALAVLNPGELVHRPTAGVGMRRRVNGLGTEESVREVEADVSAAYLADDRVRDVVVAVEHDPDRALTRLRVNVLTPQLAGESIDFTVRV